MTEEKKKIDWSELYLESVTDVIKENNEFKKLQSQLAEAKGIIKECVKHTCDTFCEVTTCEHCLFKLKVKDKAEAFLK